MIWDTVTLKLLFGMEGGSPRQGDTAIQSRMPAQSLQVGLCQKWLIESLMETHWDSDVGPSNCVTVVMALEHPGNHASAVTLMRSRHPRLQVSFESAKTAPRQDRQVCVPGYAAPIVRQNRQLMRQGH